MKKITWISLISVVLATTSSAQQSWTKQADFPTLRYRAAAFSISGKGYVTAGLTPEKRMNDLWEYDPTTNAWLRKDSLPALGRESPIAFTIAGMGYVGAGLTDSSSLPHDFWQYNPQDDSWSKKGNIPISLVSPGSMVAFAINGKGYVQASFNNDNFWQYDPTTDTWAKKANFPGGDLLSHVAFAIGSKGYVATGFLSSYYTSALWEYDPSSDQWAQKADFPGSSRDGAVAFTISGLGYVGLGNSNFDFLQDFWAYDPTTNAWTRVDSCGYGAEGAFAFSINSVGFVGTGVFTSVGEFWRYDPPSVSVETNQSVSRPHFTLRQNFPNPFNPSTTIEYSLATSSHISLGLFDCLGRTLSILDGGFRSAGDHTIRINLQYLPTGIYFYTLKTTNYLATKKLILLK
jgi:N-acetylneuraminic acid mutarotase